MRHGATASQSSLETERMNRAEMCLAVATPAGASVLRELAGAPVGGDGQLPRLPADALKSGPGWRAACPRPACSASAASAAGSVLSHVKKRRSTRLVSELSERDRS